MASRGKIPGWPARPGAGTICVDFHGEVIMYFWTNTPDQTQFIAAAAQVNRLRAYITDPNTSQEDANIYAEMLIAAGEKMEAFFDAVVHDWYNWQVANKLTIPKMSKQGTIHFVEFEPNNQEVRLRIDEEFTTASGAIYYWEDFYRMIALLSFFGRLPTIEGQAKYDPESYFHE